MKRLAMFLMTFVLVFGLSTAAFAEDERVTPRFGLGVGLGLESGHGVAGIIYAPMVVAPFLKLEPEIGLFQRSSTHGSGDYESTTTNTDFRFGFGTYFMIPIEELDFSVGLKLGLAYSGSETTTSLADESSNNKYLAMDVGPAAGLEYYFGEHFSLGADVYFRFAFEL